MLTDIVRESLSRVKNRFELVLLTSERCRQLLLGARPTVDNPLRERMSKVAMREVVAGNLIRESGDTWRVNRPGLSDLFTEPTREEIETRDSDEAS